MCIRAGSVTRRCQEGSFRGRKGITKGEIFQKFQSSCEILGMQKNMCLKECR